MLPPILRAAYAGAKALVGLEERCEHIFIAAKRR
jgi:hypothetical protein